LNVYVCPAKGEIVMRVQIEIAERDDEGASIEADVDCWRCEECQVIVEAAPWSGEGEKPDGHEHEDCPLFECTCGLVFDGSWNEDGEKNRCPDCRKFAAKARTSAGWVAEHACHECGEGGLVPLVRLDSVKVIGD
jgi:hypothetical protein